MFRVASFVALLWAGVADAQDARWLFSAIEGGTIDISAHDGPVLVVNTASLCGFTPQYEGLQALQDSLGDAGLMVLAVPSNDFRQELDSEGEVKAFCELNYDLSLPMTEITHVRGSDAHPFYRWLAEDEGWSPRWNFNKVLLKGEKVLGTYSATTRPASLEGPIRDAMEPPSG